MMKMFSVRMHFPLLALLVLVLGAGNGAAAYAQTSTGGPDTGSESVKDPAKNSAKKATAKAEKKNKALDRSGKVRRGKASYYHKKFSGRKMADGTPMDPESNVAASRTLPLGTKAKVTNLENGKSTEVEIRDRGPYVDGRIVDVSPKVARKLDIEEQGVAPVEVKPIEIPAPDGTARKAETPAAAESGQAKP